METLTQFRTRLGCPEDLAGYHTTCPHDQGGVQGAHVGSPVNSYPRVKTLVYE